MKVAIDGFNQEKLVYLGLNIIHSKILEWLVYFAHSGNQTIIKTKNDKEHYYWVEYHKVFEDFPTLPFRSNQTISKIFEDLSGKTSKTLPIEKFPLIKIVVPTIDGKMVGFAIRENIIEWLRDSGGIDMNSLITNKPIESKKPTAIKNNCNKNATQIMDKLLQIKLPDGSKLFRNRLNKDGSYTKGMKEFCFKLTAIYKGSFLKTFRQADEFIAKNKDHSINSAKEIILNCQGSWNSIEEVIIKAAKNYITWFDPSNNPSDKNWLPKNIDSWLFNYNSNGSLFLACLDGPAFPMREVSAEKIFLSIPKEVRIIFKEFIDERTDGFAFWSRIKSLVSWYKKYANDLMNEDSNCTYWLDCGIEKWLYEYVSFLKSFIDHVYLSHLGTNCPTWSAYLLNAKKEHDIKAFLNKS
jgi:hypothetical protein